MIAREDIDSLINRGNALLWGARLRRGLVWGIALIMLLPALIAVGSESASQNLSLGTVFYERIDGIETPLILYRWDGTAWGVLEAPVRSTNGNPLYTLNSHEGLWLYSNEAIYHHVGSEWVTLTLPEAIAGGYMYRHIGAGEVWITDFEQGLWQHDGTTWMYHERPSVVYTLASGRDGTFTIDADLNLARFVEGTWSSEPLLTAIPALSELPDFEDNAQYLLADYAVLHQSADSDLYLDLNGFNYGIWRFDGQAWGRVDYGAGAVAPNQYGEYYLLRVIETTANGDVLWLSNYGGIQRVEVATGTMQTIPAPASRSADAWVSDFAIHSGEILVQYALDEQNQFFLSATDEDGSEAWRTLPLPTLDENLMIQDVRFDAEGMPVLMFQDNTAMIAFYTDLQRRSELAIVPSAVGTLSGWLAIILENAIFFVIPLADVLIRTLPELLILRRRSRDTQATFTPLLTALGIAVTPTPNPLGFLLLLVYVLLRLLVVAIFVYVMAQLMVLLFAMVATYGSGDSIQSIREVAGAPLILGIGALVGYGIANLYFAFRMTGDMRQYQNLLQRILSADYESVLAATSDPQSHPQNLKPVIAYLHCFALYSAGRSAEAEAAIRALLSSLPVINIEFTSGIVMNFASVITFQKGATIEAEQLLWAGLSTTSELSNGYYHLALYYLDYDPKPAQALALSAAALHFSPQSRWKVGFNRHIARTNHAEYLGVRAQALAANGQFAEADAVLAQALAVNLEWNKIVASSLQIAAGRIATFKGDMNAARTYYERAIEIDPNGLQGQQARAALAALTTA